MTITRVLATLVILAGVAVGSASPARAAEIMQGAYTYTQEGLPPSTWTIYPMCVPVVGDLREPLYLPVGCELHVTSSTSSQTTQELQLQNYGGDARLVSDLWTVVVPKEHGLLCPDGTTAPTVETYKFDNATLAGTHTVTHNEACGVPAAVIKQPFTLTFDQPLPIPVEPYPLPCEPGGLRMCR